MTKRHGTILVLVLLMLALASALTLPLARIGLSQSFTAHRATNGVRHRVAADSILMMLPTLLGKGSYLVRDLDDDNHATVELDLGGIVVQAIIQDDSAKFPIAAWAREKGANEYESAIEYIGRRVGLAVLAIRPKPASGIGCLDDVFQGASDEDLFGSKDAAITWASMLTPLGQSVNIRRAHPATLVALLAGIDAKVAERLARATRRSDRKSVAEIIAAFGVSGDVASKVERQLTTETTRYSVLFRTTIESDIRRRFVICTAGDPPQVMVDWELAP